MNIICKDKPIDGLPIECLRISRQWTRLGVRFSIEPTTGWVDLEKLIVDTGTWARHDPRLFVMAASWLAHYHHFLNTRRIKYLLVNQSEEVLATTGALLAMAKASVTGLTPLKSALSYCQPMSRVEPLFHIATEHPPLLKRVQREALPLYLDWGFWHNDDKLKLKALHTLPWVLKNCPEMRIRAIWGTGLESEIIEGIVLGVKSMAEQQGRSGATYASIHAGVGRLAGRGIIERGEGRSWQLSLAAAEVLHPDKAPSIIRGRHEPA